MYVYYIRTYISCGIFVCASAYTFPSAFSLQPFIISFLAACPVDDSIFTRQIRKGVNSLPTRC